MAFQNIMLYAYLQFIIDATDIVPVILKFVSNYFFLLADRSAPAQHFALKACVAWQILPKFVGRIWRGKRDCNKGLYSAYIKVLN